MGADGAATLGALGQRTARQTTRKLEIVAGSMIIGESGPVGLQQRFADEAKNLWDARAFAGPLSGPEAMVKIAEGFRKHIMSELQAAASAAPVVGHAVCQTSAISQAMLALPVARSAHLFQFDQQGSPEEASDNLPFVAIGSGQSLADPFLAFIRRVVWKDAIPNLNKGIFATLWVLHHAIKTNPGGISEPMQIAVLEKSGTDWKPRILGEEEHFKGIEEWEEYLGKYFTTRATEPTPEVPKPAPAPKTPAKE